MERRKWIILFILSCLYFSGKAQPGFNNNVEDAPIDGGLSVLLAAGVGYGAKKLRDQQIAQRKDFCEDD